jgi:hypothetical protein
MLAALPDVSAILRNTSTQTLTLCLEQATTHHCFVPSNNTWFPDALWHKHQIYVAQCFCEGCACCSGWERRRSKLLSYVTCVFFPSFFFLLFVLCCTWLYPLFFIPSFPPTLFLPSFLLPALFRSSLLPHDIVSLSFFNFPLFYYLPFLPAVFFVNFWLFSTLFLPSIYPSFLLSFFILSFHSNSMTYNSPRVHKGLIHAITPCPASEQEGTKEYDPTAWHIGCTGIRKAEGFWLMCLPSGAAVAAETMLHF